MSPFKCAMFSLSTPSSLGLDWTLALLGDPQRSFFARPESAVWRKTERVCAMRVMLPKRRSPSPRRTRWTSMMEDPSHRRLRLRLDLKMATMRLNWAILEAETQPRLLGPVEKKVEQFQPELAGASETKPRPWGEHGKYSTPASKEYLADRSEPRAQS